MTSSTSVPENNVLARWNDSDAETAVRDILPCCGSVAWAEGVTSRRPFNSPDELFAASDSVWQGLSNDDWCEAFDSHPRIGQQHAKSAAPQSLSWSKQEQSAAATPDEAAKQALAEANRKYEARFGLMFIVCATGKSAAEIFAICEGRLKNDSATEMLEAAEQQRQITQLRLRRWLGVN